MSGTPPRDLLEFKELKINLELKTEVQRIQKYLDRVEQLRRSEVMLAALKDISTPLSTSEDDQSSQSCTERKPCGTMEGVSHLTADRRIIFDKVKVMDPEGNLHAELDIQFNIREFPVAGFGERTYALAYEYTRGEIVRTMVDLRSQGAQRCWMKATTANRFADERVILGNQFKSERLEPEQNSEESRVNRNQKEQSEETVARQSAKSVPVVQRPEETVTRQSKESVTQQPEIIEMDPMEVQNLTEKAPTMTEQGRNKVKAREVQEQEERDREFAIRLQELMDRGLSPISTLDETAVRPKKINVVSSGSEDEQQRDENSHERSRTSHPKISLRRSNKCMSMRKGISKKKKK